MKDFFTLGNTKKSSHILGERDCTLFCEFYDITPQGNFEGRNILHNKELLEEFAAKKTLDPQQLSTLFAKQREILFEVREGREHPFKDDKILSSWNGLMIFALAEAGGAFEKKKYLDAAINAARFIKNNMWKEGKLLHRWREEKHSTTLA